MSTKTKINVKDKVNDGEIDLSVSEIKDVPVKEIASFKKVFSLDLSNNLIVNLPKQFAPLLVHITKLDLSKNQLCELPENFGELVKLKHLDLYRNQLQHLPLSFGKLVALRWLDLKDNQLLPVIRETAGVCGDSKECQQCAKDVVAFYAKMAASVEEEKMARERQREEDRKQKELALKTQKHKDKKKKNKLNKLEQQKQQEELLKIQQQQKTKEQGPTKNGSLAMNNGQLYKNNLKKIEENKKANNKKKNNSKQSNRNKSISFCSLFCNVIWTLLMVAVTIFVLTSIKAPITQPIENKVVEWYNSVVIPQIPTDYRPMERQWTEALTYAHNVTGNSLLRLYDTCAAQLDSAHVQRVWQPLRNYVVDSVKSVYGHLITPRE